MFLNPAFLDCRRATALITRPIRAVKKDSTRPTIPSVRPGSVGVGGYGFVPYGGALNVCSVRQVAAAGVAGRRR